MKNSVVKDKKGSSVLILSDLATRLSCKVGEIFQSYRKGMVSKDNKRLWKGFYKAQMTMWFVNVWPDFKSSCHTLMEYYPECEALKNIANVRITAMTSDKDRWTKGDAFKEVFANLKEALYACDKKDVADELFNKFDLMIQFIEENEDEDAGHSTSIYSGNSKEPKKIASTSANVELLVNVQILKLPKELQQKAREYIFQDSKLQQNLQQFKLQHNIA